jgi:putative membrane protein
MCILVHGKAESQRIRVREVCAPELPHWLRVLVRNPGRNRHEHAQIRGPSCHNDLFRHIDPWARVNLSARIGFMSRFIVHWLITAVALAAAAHVVPGIHVASLPPLLLAALALGLVNAFVKPVLVLLTLPITILSLGLFYLVVNGIAFALAAALVPGFSVGSLGAAILGALVVGLVSWLLGWLLRPR